VKFPEPPVTFAVSVTLPPGQNLLAGAVIETAVGHCPLTTLALSVKMTTNKENKILLGIL
jgi:hypothetical protein